jgi:hypothetical protein
MIIATSVEIESTGKQVSSVIIATSVESHLLGSR